MKPGRTKPEATQILPGERVRIHFDVDPQGGGIIGETMWGEKVGDRRYRLGNVPFYVFGVSWHDIVFADEVKGLLTFTGVSLRGGHSTYRVLQARNLDPAVFSRHWQGLKQLGCSYEGGGDGLLAVDVPPDIDLRAVRVLLLAGERARVWQFEEAHAAHR
ncbi:MAG TPA: DUF4265 domain-containing protein [Burkholderiales bacterium]|nr:DUF4265 domain-containing protein [Burkholderiales bacterium]